MHNFTTNQLKRNKMATNEQNQKNQREQNQGNPARQDKNIPPPSGSAKVVTQEDQREEKEEKPERMPWTIEAEEETRQT
jgi:hypothetical protein